MWITESNRKKHLLYGAISAIFFTILCTLGAAFALEYKDKSYGNKWDWLDIAATMVGGFVGQIIQILLYTIIF